MIGIAFIYTAFRAIGHFRQKRRDPYVLLKVSIGKALQLGLEFLVAADIIRTITAEPTTAKIVALGLLIVARTFLSWSIAVEIEGCWPWQVVKNRKRTEAMEVWQRVIDNLFARLDGPLHFRLIAQPLMAAIFATIAVILDVTYQLKVDHWIYPGETFLVAFTLAIVPYLLLRGPINRVLQWRSSKMTRDLEAKNLG